ncbi:MAG: sce7726 family protein [Gemmatimonadaceae bacterium]
MLKRYRVGLDGAVGPFRGAESRLCDRDIRDALTRNDGPVPLGKADCLLPEVRCWRGHARADYIYLNGRDLSVVEIKSDCDTLHRFDEQVRVFSAIADRAILVVGWRLAARALRVVPAWWDVWLAERGPSSETRLVPLRDGKRNPDVLAGGLVSMLPVAEARRLALNANMPASHAGTRELRQALANRIPRDVIRDAVQDWLVRLSAERRDARDAANCC